MNVDTLLSRADLPLTTTDTEAALAATVERGRRRRRGRKLAVGCAAAALVALLSAAVLTMDRGDRHQVVAGPPPTTDTTVPTVPEPGDVAVWDVDPADRDSLSTAASFTALVTRLGCNEGATGRVLRPGVVATDTEVIITFTVAANDGVATCQGNNQVPREVEIGQPIGDRVLVDGACLQDDAAGTSFCEDGGIRRRSDAQYREPVPTGPTIPIIDGRLENGTTWSLTAFPTADGFCEHLSAGRATSMGCSPSRLPAGAHLGVSSLGVRIDGELVWFAGARVSPEVAVVRVELDAAHIIELTPVDAGFPLNFVETPLPNGDQTYRLVAVNASGEVLDTYPR